MSYISLSQAFANWQELAADIPKDDGPMMAESWNDYTDSLCKDGQLCTLQYHYAPAYDDAMPGEGSRYDELSDDREFILSAMGITLEARFIPFSMSRNRTEKSPSLNWLITVKKGGREFITCDYSQGCAHCPAYSQDNLRVTKNRIASECETGTVSKAYMTPPYFHAGTKAIPAPDLADVFYALLSDSRAIDCSDFADWCADYGYDTDSIKAREAYDACLATATKFRATFGGQKVEELHDLFEGM